MAYPLGLTLYNLASRPVVPDPALRPVLGHMLAPVPASGLAPVQRPVRPRGLLVWLHAPGDEGLPALQELARHLIEDDGVAVLLTTPHTLYARPDGPMVQPPPSDTPRDAQMFLDHWKPDVVVFSDGELWPAMVHECTLRKLPLLMVNARAPRLLPGRDGWYPGLIKSTLQAFRHILVLDDAAARAFRKAGVDAAPLTVSGRMEEASAVLPHVERDRAALAAQMATRPIWLAADVCPSELPDVIAAHRAALQLAHRLLLILVPTDTASAAVLAEKLETDEDWHVAVRRNDQDPDPEVQVYIVDASEYGLWYRLAPVTFLGGSLDGSGSARNPMEPAAHGSAILYGPRPGLYGLACGRLGAARAARMVASGGDLAGALGDLLSPDRAARQARAAWTVASEGAEVSEQVMTMIRAILDGA